MRPKKNQKKKCNFSVHLICLICDELWVRISNFALLFRVALIDFCVNRKLDSVESHLFVVYTWNAFFMILIFMNVQVSNTQKYS